MSQPSLVEILQSIGLLNAFEIGQLRQLDSVMDDRTLSLRALELGMITDEGLARALAQQYRLNMVPEERLQKLVIPPEMLSVLPRALMTEALLLPTFFDAEKKILSLLTADPGDLQALREAQVRSNSSRLRLFVAPRSAMRALLARTMPPEAPPGPPAPTTTPEMDRFLTLAWEPSAEVASVLAQLYTLEFSTIEVVSDPDHAEALLQSGQILRLLYRQSQEEGIQPRLESWRRHHPRLLIGALPNWAALHTVAYPQAQAERWDLLERLLPLLEAQTPEARARCRRTLQLSRRMAIEADIPLEAQDHLLAAALSDGLLSGEAEEGLPPGAAGVLGALERRLQGQEAPGSHPGAGLLYTARAAVRLGILDGADPVAVFGDDAPGHDAVALRALQAALAWFAIRPASTGPVTALRALLVDPDPQSSLALEAKLRNSGFQVTLLADGEQASQTLRARQEPPIDALICAMRVPRRDGLSLLMSLRRDPRTSGLAVILLSDTGGTPDVLRGLELGADEVLPRSVAPEVLVARLRHILRRQPRHAPGISGRIQNMPLEDLLQSICMGGRTTWVRIQAPDAQGSLQIRSGEIVAAEFAGRLEGVAALNALIELDQGGFEAFFEDRGQQNLSGNSSFLLLEAVRLRDERRG